MIAPLLLFLSGCQVEAESDPSNAALQQQVDELSETVERLETDLAEADLVERDELDAYATEQWVTDTIDDTLPAGSLATQAWVDANYTSNQALDDALPEGTLATQSWVTSTIDAALPIGTIATESWAESTFATPQDLDDALPDGTLLTQAAGDGRYVQATAIGRGLLIDGQDDLVVDDTEIERLAAGVAYDTNKLTDALGDAYLSATDGDLLLDGAVRFAGAGATCTGDELGLLRYVGGRFEGCTPDGWSVLASALGATDTHAAASCRAIADERPAAPSGGYWLQGEQGPYRAWCDQDHRGGGWQVVFSYQEAIATTDGAAPFYDAITTTASMDAPVTPASHTTAILTDDVPLAEYTEVVYGWVPAGAASPSRWGTYTRAEGLAGACYLDGHCGNDVTVATMQFHPTGSERSVATGNSPPSVHVGLGWSSQQIVWGYDAGTHHGSNWGNWNDAVTCCSTGNTLRILEEGWRYVIYLR